MTDFNAAEFVNDFVKGEPTSTPGFNATDFVNNFIAADPAPSTNGAIDDGFMEVSAAVDQAEGKEEVNLELPDEPLRRLVIKAKPLPSSVGEAITTAGRHGITMEFSEGLWDDLDARAKILAFDMSRQLGIDLNRVPAHTYDDLVAAHRWTLVRLHSEPSDEETDEILRSAGQRAIQTALDRGFGQLAEFDQALEGTQTISLTRDRPVPPSLEEQRLRRDREELQQRLARLQSTASLLEQNDPRARHAVRGLLGDAMKKRDRADLESSLAVRQLNSLFGEPVPQKAYRDGRGLENFPRRVMRHQDQLADDLSAILDSASTPNGSEEALRLATNSAVQRVKLTELGISEEQIRTQGIGAAVVKNYGELVSRALLQSAGDNVPTFAELEKAGRLQDLMGIIDEALDDHNLTAEERLKALDPNQLSPVAPTSAVAARGVDNAKNAIATAAGTAFSFVTDLLEGVSEMSDSSAEIMGWKLEPWQIQAADKERIKRGIEHGDVDVSTLMRWTGAGKNPVGFGLAYILENLGGEIANVGDFMRWQATGGETQPQKTDKLGLGKIAAERLARVPSSALTPELAKAMLADSVTELSQLPAQAGGLKIGRDFIQQRQVEASADLREGRPLSALYKSVTAALGQVLYVDIAETMGLVVQEPSALPTLAGLSWAGGRVGGSMFRHVDSALDKMAARATLVTRLKRATRDLAAHDPDALKNLSEAGRSMGIRGVTEHKVAAITNIAEQLADEAFVKLRDVRRLTQRDHDRFWQRRRRKVRELDKHLGGMNADNLTDLLDKMQVPTDLIAAVRNPVRTSFLGELTSGVLNKLHLGGFRVLPGTRIRNFTNLARRANSLLDNNTPLDEIGSMAVPVVGYDQGYRWWGRRVLDAAADQFPALKAFNRRANFEDVSVTAEMGKWFKDMAPIVTALRDHNLLMKGRQEDLLMLARRRVRTQSQVLRKKNPAVMTKKDRREMQRLLNQDRRLRAGLEEVNNRGWREPVRLSANEALLDELTFTDIHTWWKAQGGSPAQHELWSFLARRDKHGRITEKIDAFKARMQQVEQLESDALEGRLKGDKRKAALRKVRDVKKSVLRRLYDREIPRKILKLDDDTDVFNGAWVDKIRRMRRKAEQADDEDRLAELPEITDPELPESLRRMNDLANTLDATVFREVFEKNGAWDYGSPTQMLEQMRQLQIDRKNQLYSHGLVVQRFMDEFNKLDRPGQAAINHIIERAASGDFKSWDDFWKRNPKLAARFYQSEKFANVARAFEDMESLRADKLRHMRLTGQIDPGQYEDLIRPYHPHLYSVEEFPKMVGRVVRKRLEQAGGDTVALSRRIEITNEGAFELQRDFYRHRLQVKRAGSDWIDLKFDTAAEAKRWLRERYGIRKGSDRMLLQGAGTQGLTEFGDEFVLLDPLPPEHAAQLGLLGAGPALGKRLTDIARQSALYDLFKSLDRPGWAVDEPIYRRAVTTERGRRKYRGFVKLQLPESQMFLPLQGKFVHRSALYMMQHFIETDGLLDQMQKQMIEAALADTPLWGRPAARALSLVGGLGRAIRTVLSTNLIARNPGTHAGNRFYDKQVLARVAAGAGYLKSRLGKEAQRVSKEYLLGWGPKVRGVPRINAAKSLATSIDEAGPKWAPLIREGIEEGAIGDSMVGNPLTGELQESLTRGFWGPEERRVWDALRPRSKRKGAARKKQRLKEVDEALNEWADTDESPLQIATVARLQAERMALEEAIGVETSGLGRRAVDGARWLVGLRNRFGTFDEKRAWANQLYAREGNIDRLGVYIYLRAKGMPRALAAKRMRMFMQDYSNVRGFVKLLRNNPVANPIFSFPAEWFRINANILREHPSFLVGMASAAPAISAPTLMAQGLDPVEYYMAMNKGNGIDALEMAMGTLVLPNPSGIGVSTIEISALNPLQMLRRPVGMMGALLDNIEKFGVDLSHPLALAASIATRLVSQVAFQNPQLNAGWAIFAGRDPLSQERINGGVLARAGEASAQLSRMLVPGGLPWYSNASEATLDTLRLPKNMNTNRITTAAERFLQSYTGVRVRGGIIEETGDIAERVVGANPVTEGMQVVLQIMGAAPAMPGKLPVHIPEVLPRSKGFTEEDVATMLFYGAAKFSAEGSEPGHYMQDRILMDLRTAQRFLQHGEKTGDKKTVEWAKRVWASARDELKESIEARKLFAEIAGEEAGELQLDREGRAKVKRVLEASDLGNQFARADLNRQVMSLIAMSEMRLSDDLIKNLTKRALYVNKDNFSPTEWTNPASIQAAMDSIERHIKTARPGATGISSLDWFYAQLARNINPAKLRDEGSTWRRTATREAAKLWREMEDEP